jgi:hypothetical protein
MAALAGISPKHSYKLQASQYSNLLPISTILRKHSIPSARIVTTINNPRRFKVRRMITWKEIRRMRWMPMRHVAGGRAIERSAASTSAMGSFSIQVFNFLGVFCQPTR